MITLRGALLTARYVRRAVHEASSARDLYNSLARQAEVARCTIIMLNTLARFCGCSESPIPLVYAHCPPCTLRLRLLRVMMMPEHYTTQQQHAVITAASDTLRAAGYLS